MAGLGKRLFVGFSMIVLSDDTEILIQSEDRASQQERLRHIVEQPARHVVDVDHLVSHHHDAAHDEQHRAGIPKFQQGKFIPK